MKTITIITPANIEVEYRLAGVGSRLAAFIIDTLVQFLAMLLAAAVIFAITHRVYLSGVDVQGSTSLAIFIVVIFVIFFGYHITLELLMNGQTLGKRMFGMRVIRDNGQPVEFTHVLIRGLIRPVLDMIYVGLFVILFSKKHKRIGDMAAGTIVVVENYDSDFILGIKDWDMPAAFPPLSEMSGEERDIVEDWLRRRESFLDQGMELEMKLSKYFSGKAVEALSVVSGLDLVEYS